MVVVSCGGDKRKSPANKNDFLFSGTENPVSAQQRTMSAFFKKGCNFS